MGALKQTVIRTGLETLYFSGAHALLRPWLGGAGMILTFHHVRPARPQAFQPNRLLEVTPEFFASVMSEVRRAGLDVVSLDEMHRRLTQGDLDRRFVCITFDDGYRDTLEHAYPILKAHGMPFAQYIATSFPDRHGELWWIALEAVIARQDSIVVVLNGEEVRLPGASLEDKNAAFDRIYTYLRERENFADIIAFVRDLAARHGVDPTSFCADLCMGWDELAQLAADPLVTIGAHTVTHPILKKIAAADALNEIEASRAAIESRLGVRADHFAYPVGDPTSAGMREFSLAADAGFKTAVTTRPGVLFPAHADHLMALPRVSVNGQYQQLRFLRVLMSGAATALWNGFRKVNAA
ncbi:MAG TPA: polysaccharide deacetylase family protein [Xanthobacteraceae bacterium]|nr:polysaccharide deacetylase family protein [Xanthobacteraceae bacterium]